MTVFDIDTYDTTFGLIRKIYLCGMPIDANYTLYVNDVCALESKEEEGCQIFDMCDNSRSRALDFLIKAAVGYDEEGIENRHEYLNFDRVDKVSILSNKQIGDGEYNIFGHWRHGPVGWGL